MKLSCATIILNFFQNDRMFYIIFSTEKRHRIKSTSYKFPTTIKYNKNINKHFLNVKNVLKKNFKSINLK